MKEQQQYDTIKELVDRGGNKNRAAVKLGCSRRSIDRHIAGYKIEGKAYFMHGNTGRIPAHAFSHELKSTIAGLYLSGKYGNASFAYFTELIQEDERMPISESAARNIFAEKGIISPYARRETKRAANAVLAAASADAGADSAADDGRRDEKPKTVAPRDAHPRRPRCPYFGEMIQMDASLHNWFGDAKATLHLAVDDATGMVVGAWFDNQETLKGYYSVFRQILTEYGIPYMFYTDRRTVFEYRKSGSQDTADDSFTQFGYACSQLGVQIKTTSVPQAKGRIERLNQTMQSRLPTYFRKEGATTIEQANEYLPRFIEKFNARFAPGHNSIASVFETQPPQDEIDRILAVVAERIVDAGHSVRLNRRYWRTVDKGGSPVYLSKGTKGLAIRTLSGQLFFSVDGAVFALEEIPSHERVSRNFDAQPPESKPQKRYIPPASHPWRLAAFAAFVKKQAKRSDSAGSPPSLHAIPL